MIKLTTFHNYCPICIEFSLIIDKCCQKSLKKIPNFCPTPPINSISFNLIQRYTLCLNVERTKALSTLSLVSPVRQTLEFQLELANPSDAPADYEVTIDGEFVTGEQRFTLEAN